MRFRVILSLMTMALACFTVAVWTSSLPADDRQNIPNNDDSPHQEFE
jgi:hypothetical protein